MKCFVDRSTCRKMVSKKAKKINSILDISLMKYVAPCCGILMPGLEKNVYFPKITMLFYSYIVYFTLFIVGSFGVLNYVSVLLSPEDGLEMQLYFFVMGSNSACTVSRVAILLFHKKDVEELMVQVNRNFLNPMQPNIRETNARKYLGFLNILFYANIIIQQSMTLFVQVVTPINKKEEVHKMIFPGDRNDPRVLGPLVIYECFVAVMYIFGMSAFEWSLLAFVRLTTVEMLVLRQQLTGIFSSLRYDENSQPIMRKFLSSDLLNFVLNTDYVESEWLSVREHPEYYKEKINLLNTALDNCIIHHAATIKMSRTVRKIYGLTIAITYAFTVLFSTSWIVSAQSQSALVMVISPFAAIALLTLYLNSYCGEECVVAVSARLCFSSLFIISFFQVLLNCGRHYWRRLASLSNQNAKKVTTDPTNDSKTITHGFSWTRAVMHGLIQLHNSILLFIILIYGFVGLVFQFRQHVFVEMYYVFNYLLKPHTYVGACRIVSKRY